MILGDTSLEILSGHLFCVHIYHNDDSFFYYLLLM